MIRIRDKSRLGQIINEDNVIGDENAMMSKEIHRRRIGVKQATMRDVTKKNLFPYGLAVLQKGKTMCLPSEYMVTKMSETS